MDSPGSGKSLMAIMTFCNLYKQGKIDGIFLISKNGLSYHWLKEILIFTNVFKEEDILLVNNDNKKNVFEQHTDKKVIIVPNHLLADMMLSYRKVPVKKTADGKKKRVKSSRLQWKAKISIKEKWQKKCLALVVDEAHCFKYSTSTRSKVLAAYINEFEYRSFYSATPAINRFEDYYFQMKLLDPAIINETEGSFLLKIGEKIGGTYDPWEVKKYNSEAVLYFKNRMLPSTIKRLKEELPEMKTKRIISPIYLQMGYTHRRIYNLYAKKEKQGLSLTQKLEPQNLQSKFVDTCLALDNPFLIQQKYAHKDRDVEFILRKYKFEDDTRITFLDELCEEVIKEKGEKLVVFDTHPLTLDMLQERYAEYHPLIIHGQKNTGEKERSDIETLFNDKNSKHKLILLSSMTSSAGINLQKGANRVVFFTQPWNTTDYSQAIERTYRIVSEKDTIVYLLVFDKSLDVYRLGKNLNRVEFSDSLFNSPLDENQVEKLLNCA
jgi:SNF2 family DNA or RNA helicase